MEYCKNQYGIAIKKWASHARTTMDANGELQR